MFQEMKPENEARQGLCPKPGVMHRDMWEKNAEEQQANLNHPAAPLKHCCPSSSSDQAHTKMMMLLSHMQLHPGRWHLLQGLWAAVPAKESEEEEEMPIPI